MLNTKNWLETAIVYIAIFCLLALTLWLAADWPDPRKIFSDFLASDAAREIDRYQVLLGMLSAATLLALAYVFNGNRERRHIRNAEDQGARSTAHGLALEAANLAEACDRHVLRLTTLAARTNLPDGDIVKLQETEKQLSLTDNLSLLDLGHDELAKLGYNGHAGVNQIRQSLRMLEQVLSDVGDNEDEPTGLSAELRELANAYAGVSLSSSTNLNLFETLYRSGVATANERTPPDPISRSDIARHIRALTDPGSLGNPAAVPIRAAM